jgi:hypothetical protein
MRDWPEKPVAGPWAALACALVLGVSAQAAGAGVEARSAQPVERLSSALAAGHLRADDVRGREVYAYDETRIGTVANTGRVASVTLDQRLGLGEGCVVAPLSRLLVSLERRLLLDMTPQEFEAALRASRSCGE